MESVIGYLENELQGCYKAKSDYLRRGKDHLAYLVQKRIDEFEKAISILNEEAYSAGRHDRSV